MFTKKTIGIAVAGALALAASGVAFATPVDVNGVMWDTSSPFNLTIQSLNLRETSVSNVGDVLHGYGQIGSINGDNNFCNKCELTFKFTYTLAFTGPGTNGGTEAVFNGGSFQFYTQNPGTFKFGKPNSVGGTPWVTLTGHAFVPNGYTPFPGGELFSNVFGTVSSPGNGSGGYGLVDATGGPAQSVLDIYKVSDGMGGFANLTLNSSFLYFPANNCKKVTTNLDNVCSYPIEGNGSLVGKSTAVPEPGEIGLLGLGLGFLGLLIRRRRKESEGQA